MNYKDFNFELLELYTNYTTKNKHEASITFRYIKGARRSLVLIVQSVQIGSHLHSYKWKKQTTKKWMFKTCILFAWFHIKQLNIIFWRFIFRCLEFYRYGYLLHIGEVCLTSSIQHITYQVNDLENNFVKYTCCRLV